MGQNAIYYKGKSYSDGGGSGGTEVIPNPQGEATGTLTKLSVDGDVYEIPEINVEDVYVNGTSALDENSIAQIKSYQEITKAEYDALPSSKLTDDILYCITDGGATEPGEYFNPVIYSLTEREIGVWIDGKPLYQKTIHLSALPSTANTIVNYQHNISDIDTICSWNGLVRWSTGTVRFMPNAQFADSSLNTSGSFDAEISKTEIRVWVGRNRSELNGDFTIWYTKTTDTPGSGKYTTLGIPSVHYSTDEQVIGTWVDGKPIYEITLPMTQNLTLTANTWVVTQFDKDVKENLIKATIIMPSVLIDNLQAGFSNDKVMLNCPRNMGINPTTGYYLVLQYTKTTD